MNTGNRHCATAFALVLAITVFAPQPSHANKKASDTKAQKSQSDKPESSATAAERTEQNSKTEKAKNTKVVGSKSTAAAKSESATKRKRVTKPVRNAKPVAPAATVEDEGIYDDVPWYEQPLKTKATQASSKKVDKSKGKSKANERQEKQRARYGGVVGLGSRSSGDGPAFTERRSKETRPKLNRKRVVKEIRFNQRSIAYCRAKAGKAVKSTQLVLRFHVGENGAATAVQVSDTRGSKIRSMSRCLETRMKSWSFPTGSRGGAIEYPLMVREFKATRLGK